MEIHHGVFINPFLSMDINFDPLILPCCGPGGMSDKRKFYWHDILPGSYDPLERLKVMKEESIDKALLFPSIHLFRGDVHDQCFVSMQAQDTFEQVGELVAQKVVCDNPMRFIGL